NEIFRSEHDRTLMVIPAHVFHAHENIEPPTRCLSACRPGRTITPARTCIACRSTPTRFRTRSKTAAAGNPNPLFRARPHVSVVGKQIANNRQRMGAGFERLPGVGPCDSAD